MSEALESAEIGELLAALAAAQAEMPNAKLDQTNPHFKSKFASLASVKDASLPTLTKHGLSILQLPRIREDGRLVLYTQLGHKSGQWVAGEFPLPDAIDKPQTIGSALTYGKRYSWSGAAGVVADEDDDGQAAQQNANPPAKPKTSSGSPKPPAPPAAAPESEAKGTRASSPAAAVSEDEEIIRLRRRWNAIAKGLKKTEDSEAAAISDRWKVKSLDDLDAGQWEAEIEVLKSAPKEAGAA